MDNLLEESVAGEFNPVVHESTENGDPKRNQDGSIQLKTNWKKVAVDRQGRGFNSHVHGEEEQLDAQGFLKVRRRDTKQAVGGVSRSAAFVEKYREKGYAYYIANDEGGRVEQMLAADWEPVLDGKGPAELAVGQARSGNAKARLFRKPEEWYLADQEAKAQANRARFEQTSSPSEEDGQYTASESSPHR